MSYADIDNLYKNQEILLFRECFAMEKIHGTSAYVTWREPNGNRQLTFFSGGMSHDAFVALFNAEELTKKLVEMQQPEVTIYGEAYGGKCQKMSATYGKSLRFIAFDVNISGNWLSIPQAEEVAKALGLEFVHYVRISTDLAAIDAQRDAPSEQAFRNGCADRNDPATFKKREGTVLRPIIEVRKNNGERIVAKHKREDFQERKSQPEVADPEKLKVLADAQAIADEWVNEMRLAHVLDHVRAAKQKELGMEDTPDIIKEMLADVSKEAKGEIVESKESRKAISGKTVQMFKDFLKNSLKENFE